MNRCALCQQPKDDSDFAALAVEYPDVVEVVHLDEWFAESGATTDESMREDGLHLTDAGALRVMDEFLGPVLLRLTVV